jgi:hypothetical protein
MGWLTVALYSVASIMAILTLSKTSGRVRLFWFILSILLGALAVNKQLDLQSGLTALARCIAKADGWYADRRSIQVKFILTVAGASFALAALLFWTLRRSLKSIWLALLGLNFLLGFVVMRAAGFHHFDVFIGSTIGGLRMNWILEIGGILMIIVNETHSLRRPVRPIKSLRK